MDSIIKLRWGFHFATVIFLWLCVLQTNGQSTYYMDNQVIDECEGILKDSDANEDFPGYYNHNESFLTTICVESADELILRFTEFHLEEDFDFLTIYDGADTTGNILGQYTGFGIPSSLNLSDVSCITLHFTSDDNVTEFGFTMIWEAIIDDPEPVVMSLMNPYSCTVPEMRLLLSEPVLCDSISHRKFSIVGAGPVGLALVQAVNCTDGYTTEIQVRLNPVIERSGSYQLRLFSYVIDACDEIHELISTLNLDVTDCPLEVELEGSALCPGSCIDIDSEVFGGDGDYTYNWLPTGDNVPSINVCPREGDIYILEVMDGSGNVDRDTFIPEIYPRPEIFDLPSDTMCRSYGRFNLSANPPGGTWSGQGIHPNGVNTGLYDPVRTDQSTGYPDNIRYTDPNGCVVDTNVTVLFIRAGRADAVCLGIDSFTVIGGFPRGGYWTGSTIRANGTFVVGNAGSFVVTYHATNGCSMSKRVNVAEEVSFSGLDTVCSRGASFRVDANPAGGRWQDHPSLLYRYGPWMNPRRAPLGDNQLIYEAMGEGCTDTFNFFVRDLNLDKYSDTLCPERFNGTQSIDIPFTPTISGGTWSSSDVAIDTLTGQMSNDGNIENGESWVLRYENDGCETEASLFFQSIQILRNELIDPICSSQAPILIRDVIEYSPDIAVLSGSTIEITSTADTVFNPALLTDTSNIYIDYLGCREQIALTLGDVSEIINGELCSLDDPFYLDFTQAINNIDGEGILFNDEGFIDPNVLDTGWHHYTIESRSGCISEDSLYVTDREDASILDFDNTLCYKDSLIMPEIFPPGGIFYIDSSQVSGINPSLLSPGAHTLTYEVGTGNCTSRSIESIFVLDPLEVDIRAAVDTICIGESVRIEASPVGGDISGFYRINWDNNLGFGQVHYVSPRQFTNYSVTIEDGCSDPDESNISIDIYPDFDAEIQYDDPVCRDDSASVYIQVSPSGEYEIQSRYGILDSVFRMPPRIFDLTVTRNLTQCPKIYTVNMPVIPTSGASFSVYPDACIRTIDSVFEISNHSANANTFQWYLNDSLISEDGQSSFDLEMDKSGDYVLELVASYDGYCTDTFKKVLCVEDFYSIEIPTAFSPNDDGLNDVFEFYTNGIKSCQWQIYDRYGKELYSSTDCADSWDGKSENGRILSGYYLFVIQYTREDGEVITEKRGIHLLR